MKERTEASETNANTGRESCRAIYYGFLIGSTQWLLSEVVESWSMGGGPRVVVADSADTIRIPGVRSVGVGGSSLLVSWELLVSWDCD